MSQINSWIESYIQKEYGNIDTSNCILDCSLGVGTKTLPKSVMDSLRQINEEDIKNYPHNTDLLNSLSDAIINMWSPHCGMSRENIHFGCGSFDLLCGLNLLYGGRGSIIMGHAPQFTAYVDHVNCIGAKFISYPLDKSLGYKFKHNDFITMMREVKPNLTTVENPNNPTGQALPYGAMHDIVECARDCGSAVVFDEAYADYLTIEQQCLEIVEYGRKIGVDVYITRTFSKGFGMAGIRLGYVFGPKEGISQLKKIVTPFNSNEPAKRMAYAFMHCMPDYISAVVAETTLNKAKVMERIKLKGKLLIAETSPSTPLLTIYSKDDDIDLCKILLDVGIASVSCATYENLGKNAVRIMLPNDIDLLLDLIDSVNLSSS